MAGVEISSIKNADLREIAKSADKNNDGKLKRKEYTIFAQEASAKGIDAKDINEALDMNGLQRWWYDVDKISTDGKDDGKLSFKEGITSLAKGLIGGIPKAMVKHPIATVATIGVCAGLTVLTGGAILPVLTAIGLATGVGMVGVGTYKAITAKTDSEAKQALETVGMGVTTSVMSAVSAEKALAKAEQAGVKSAHVEKGANIFQKIGQTFKAIPESLKMSKNWAMSYIKGTPVYLEFVDGTKQAKVKGKPYNGDLMVEDTKYTFKNGNLKEECLSNGTYRKYSDKINGLIIEEKLPDGTYRKYSDKINGLIIEEKLPDGTYNVTSKTSRYHSDLSKVVKCEFGDECGSFTKITARDGSYKIVNDKTGVVVE
ncbi:MAG: hypothetical protein MJ237_09240, partial [bacterium]|nr:hypothetical protein [bacterium]